MTAIGARRRWRMAREPYTSRSKRPSSNMRSRTGRHTMASHGRGAPERLALQRQYLPRARPVTLRPFRLIFGTRRGLWLFGLNSFAAFGLISAVIQFYSAVWTPQHSM